MARRRGTEKTFYEVLPAIGSGLGLVEVIAPSAGYVISPISAIISSHGAGNVEVELSTNGSVFLHTHVPGNDSKQYIFPEGLELPIGSGVEVEFLSSDGGLSFYYTKYDESARITKDAARSASYIPSSATAIRAPNDIFGGQSKD